MEISDELKNFINENIDLINENTKESWEQIYEKLPWQITGEFTQTILDAGINNPAEIMGYVPEYYLFSSKITDYKIPDNVTSIGNDAFNRCSGLTSIEIPCSVTNIGGYAFYKCSKLTRVVIGDGVTSISNFAFAYCTSLKEINFKGTKRQAIQLGIGARSKREWRKKSPIKKIICTDGIIEL